MIPTFPYLIYAKVAYSAAFGFLIPIFSYVKYGKVGIGAFDSALLHHVH
jgi:hypothetical protein